MTTFPTPVESRQAARLGRSYGPDGLRKRASLVVRCDDCDGQFVLVVAYVEGRPLVATRGVGGRRPKEHRGWGFQWLDRNGHVQTRCRAGESHVWTTAELRALIPRRELRVSHP